MNIDEHVVSIQSASIHAATTFCEYAVFDHPSMVSEVDSGISWFECMLGEPTRLYDINGWTVAYAFPVIDCRRNIQGRIFVAGNKLLGSTILSVERRSQKWKVQEAMQAACNTAINAFPGWNLEKVVPVIHDFPDVGIMAIIRDPRSGDCEKVIVDINKFVRIPICENEATLSEQVHLARYSAWSPLSTVLTLDEKPLVNRWQLEHEWTQNFWHKCSGNEFNFEDIHRFKLEACINPEILKEMTKADIHCELHIAQIHEHFLSSRAGYCTVAVARTIASRYGVYDSESYVANVMGIPHPNPHSSDNWATANDELKYYKNDLKKSGSKVFSDYAYLSNYLNYKDEIMGAAAGKGPCNLRQMSIGSYHHSRALCGVRICQTPAGVKVQLGLLGVSDSTDPWIQPEHWQTFDDTKLTQGGVVSITLRIGGLVVVRD